MKHIAYTEHAREQMEHRFISREYVRQAIRSVHESTPERYGRKKINADLRGKKLVVIYGETKKEYVVITSYWVD